VISDIASVDIASAIREASTRTAAGSKLDQHLAAVFLRLNEAEKEGFRESKFQRYVGSLERLVAPSDRKDSTPRDRSITFRLATRACILYDKTSIPGSGQDGLPLRCNISPKRLRDLYGLRSADVHGTPQVISANDLRDIRTVAMGALFGAIALRSHLRFVERVCFLSFLDFCLDMLIAVRSLSSLGAARPQLARLLHTQDTRGFKGEDALTHLSSNGFVHAIRDGVEPTSLGIELCEYVVSQTS
jgi:hypothetical protein